MAILAMVVLPIPAMVLDILFSFSITLSLVVMLVAVYTQRPLDLLPFRQFCLSPQYCGLLKRGIDTYRFTRGPQWAGRSR